MKSDPETYTDAGLRIIYTARSLQAINRAVKLGFWPLVKPVNMSPPYANTYTVYQHYKTGNVKLSHDPRQEMKLWGEWRKVADFGGQNPVRFRNPYAAYLIPSDLEVDQRVWLEDLIEDLPAVLGVVQERLSSAEAIWNGQDFEVLPELPDYTVG